MKNIYWRKLEKEELQEHGDVVTIDDYQMDFDYAQMRHWVRTHYGAPPKINIVIDMIGNTVRWASARYNYKTNPEFWRPTICAEASYSDPENQERKIQMDL